MAGRMTNGAVYQLVESINQAIQAHGPGTEVMLAMDNLILLVNEISAARTHESEQADTIKVLADALSRIYTKVRMDADSLAVVHHALKRAGRIP